MIKNKFPGVCASCTRRVDVGEGFVFRRRNWETVCKSEACHRHLGLTSAVPKRLRADGALSFPYDEEALPLLRSIPGAQFNRDTREWSVSVSDADLVRTIEVCQKLGIVIELELLERHAKGTGATRAAEIRAKGLYGFQADGVGGIVRRPKTLLSDDMGLGKSVQTLMAVPWDDKVLIICPASLKFNWRDEGRRWRPDYQYTVISKRDDFRSPKRGEMVIINYDIVPDYFRGAKKNEASPAPVPAGVDLSGMTEVGRSRKRATPAPADPTKLIAPPGMVESLRDVILVCDEAHMVKSHKAKRSEKVKMLSSIAKKVILITGTPLMNKPLDLWGVLSAGGMAFEVFGSFKNFLKLFRAVPKTWGGYDFGLPEPEVSELLRRVMIRRTRKEVMPELPNKTYQEIAVDGVDGKVGKRLDEITKLLMDRGEIKRAPTGDYTGGLPGFEEFSEIRALLSESRIPAMLEMVEAAEEQDVPLVVFSDHRAPILELKKRDGWAVITGDTSHYERQQIVDRFQREKDPTKQLKGIGCTIAAGGVGITLTRASVVLFVDLNWTPALNMQSEDRVVRIGQTADSVLIQRLYTDHPLDKHIHSLLVKKQRLIAASIDASANYAASTNRAEDGGLKLTPETDVELAARLKALQEAQAEIEKQEERAWVRERLAAIRQQAGTRRPEVVFTPDKKQALREALSYMLVMCDGAVAKDFVGFNATHASTMHHVGATGLAEDDDVTFRVLERVLTIYSGTRDRPGGQLGTARCVAIWGAP